MITPGEVDVLGAICQQMTFIGLGQEEITHLLSLALQTCFPTTHYDALVDIAKIIGTPKE